MRCHLCSLLRRLYGASAGESATDELGMFHSYPFSIEECLPEVVQRLLISFVVRFWFLNLMGLSDAKMGIPLPYTFIENGQRPN